MAHHHHHHSSGLEVLFQGPAPKSGSTGKICKKTPEQLHMLKSAFVRTQWPSPEEYDKLAKESGLARTDIVSWFGDTRYAWKNGNLKWYYYYQSANS
uniref:Zinc fingers and homeoboxes protein 1 n=1 Tax=Homo sapiens TaxID=9606 RepID=UPI0001DBB66F|nr:Chain A, Zinc fingers and homeoboxes protein 1 [Homo sapiens]3NAR_B Chain B, Zinc fingers and homeoboxes protein 1 [Homo sapiens]